MSRALSLRASRARSSAARSSRRSRHTRLRGESLESRSLLAADITFAANVLTINITGAGEFVTLDVTGTTLNVESSVGTTADINAQALGFSAATGAAAINAGSIAVGNDVRRIDIVGAAGVQTVGIIGGTFTALTVVDGAQDIENVDFAVAGSTFSNISGNGDDVLSVTADDIDQFAGGTITAGGLAIRSPNPVALNEPNDVGRLAAALSTAGNDFSFTDVSGFVVDTVDGVVGINTTGPGDIVTLTAGGAVTQSAAAVVNSTSLEIFGTGPVTLEDGGNDVDAISANLTTAGAAFSYVDSNSLSIDIVSTAATAGITTNNGNIRVVAGEVAGGSLVVWNGDGDASADVDAGTGTVFLMAESFGADNTVLTSSNADVIGTGGVTLIADNIAIDADVNAGTNTALLTAFEAGTLIDLGGADGVNTLGLTDAELDLITAGLIRIGDAAGGNIFLSAPIAPANADTLSLITAGGITQAPVATITIGSLAIRAGNTVTLDQANDVLLTSLAAVVTNPGQSFSYRDVNDITIGSVDGVDGITTNNGDVSVRANSGGTITVNGVVAGAPTVFASVDVPLRVPPTGTGGSAAVPANITLSDVTVGLAGVLADVNVTIANMTHTFDGDLEITLISPAGTRITLANNSGGGGDNFFNTVFDDSAATAIAAGAPPFTGSFIPNEALANLIGEDAEGIWTLEVHDQLGGDTGFLNAWSISITPLIGGGISSTGGDITLTADDLVINTAVNAGTGVVTLRPFTLGTDIDLGTNTAGRLGLTDAELDWVTADLLRIGPSTIADIFLTAAISLNAAQVDTLSLQAVAGAIVDGTAGEQTDLTVNNLALAAESGIGSADDLDVLVSVVAAQNVTGGVSHIRVTSAGPTTIGTVDGVVGANNTTGGDISITASSPLIVASNVFAFGSVTLAASSSAAAGDDLTVNAGVSMTVFGNLTLLAGDTVHLALGSSLVTFSAVTITGGLGEVDGGGGVNLFGGLVAFLPVNVNGGFGADTFNLNPSSGPAQINAFGSSGNDIFNVTPKAATAFSIDGGSPVLPVFPGDSLDIDFTGAADPVLIPGGPGAGTYTFTNRAPIDFVSIEFLAAGDDFGDAPDTYGTLLPGGARHGLSAALFLGATIDPEADGQPSANALGDDANGFIPDDEDGVTLPGTLIAGLGATATVNVAGAGGFLNAWIDFNASGTFEISEQIASSLPVVPGNNAVTFTVPTLGTVDGATFARFRLSTNAVIGPTGFAPDGEVEDYATDITVVAPGTAGVFPDPNNPGQTILIASGGAGNDTILIDPVFAFNYRVKINGKTVLVVPNDQFQTMAVFGLGGNDRININSGFAKVATLYGGPGNDNMHGAKAADQLFGGPGNDSLYGEKGADLLLGEEGNDTVYGGDDNDQIDGGINDDKIYAGNGNDTAQGGDGNDQVRGEAGNDLLLGGNQNDTLYGGSGNDTASGDAGNDQVNGDDGNDLLRGGSGSDTVSGGSGNDILLGEADADKLLGGAGRDLLIGGIGTDSLQGDSGEDILIGGTTNHDANDAALLAISAEWGSALAYLARVTALRGGAGVNLAFGVDVNDDAANDVLKGNSDKDWFHLFAGDTSDQLATEEVN